MAGEWWIQLLLGLALYWVPPWVGITCLPSQRGFLEGNTCLRLKKKMYAQDGAGGSSVLLVFFAVGAEGSL